MLFTISRGNIPGRKQADIVYLVSAIEWVSERNLGYVFTDGHPIMLITSFFDNTDDLDKIDWNLMGATYWHDIATDLDRKRRRQAEFLVHDFFPLDLVGGIAVYDEDMEERVTDSINTLVAKPTIAVKRGWYYA